MKWHNLLINQLLFYNFIFLKQRFITLLLFGNTIIVYNTYTHTRFIPNGQFYMAQKKQKFVWWRNHSKIPHISNTLYNLEIKHSDSNDCRWIFVLKNALSSRSRWFIGIRFISLLQFALPGQLFSLVYFVNHKYDNKFCFLL